MMKNVKYMVLATFCAFILVACTKEVLKTSGKVIGERIVSSEAGEFPVLVTTTGVWTASSLSDWIDVQTDMHKDQGTVVVKYGANTSYLGKNCFNRLGKVVISTVDGAECDTLLVKQRGVDPFFNCPQVGQVPLRQGRFSIPVNSNFSDGQRDQLSFHCDAQWVSGISWGYDGKSIAFDVTASTVERSAVIYLKFTPQWGDVFEAECSIVQK